VELDHVVYDHNGGMSCSGGAMMFAGRGEENNGWLESNTYGDAAAQDALHGGLDGCNTGCGLTFNIHASMFWANSGKGFNHPTPLPLCPSALLVC